MIVSFYYKIIIITNIYIIYKYTNLENKDIVIYYSMKI